MPDRMSNRMSEDMSDRMPEDLPVRKCINVMVGITRSKVFFLVAKNMDHNHNQQQMLFFVHYERLVMKTSVHQVSRSVWWFGRFIFFPFS